MILLIPSAKTLDFAAPPWAAPSTRPQFLNQAQVLMKALRVLKPKELSQLLALSPALTQATTQMINQWRLPLTLPKARHALAAYAGDLYDGLAANSFSPDDLAFAQDRLRILSGLYGLLRPLDLILPYRLEMGTKLAAADAKDLVGFWREGLTVAVSELLALEGQNPVLLNLASQEFAKVIRFSALPGRVVTPVFQEGVAGEYKVVSFHAKRARGLMARYVVQHRLEAPEPLRAFREGGYRFAAAASTSDRWIFRREGR